MGKVLVKAAATMMTGNKEQGVGVDYDVSGKPVFVMGQGGGAGRGRSGRERWLGRAGGALGAAAGLVGLGGAQHRSLGSALGGAIGSGYQGSALGGSLGRFMTGRKGQSVANLEEQQAQDKADIEAYKKLKIPLPKRLRPDDPVKVRRSRLQNDATKVPGINEDDLKQGMRRIKTTDTPENALPVGVKPFTTDDAANIGRQVAEEERNNVTDTTGEVMVVGADGQVHGQANQIPPLQPTASATEASAGSAINNVESAGNQEAMRDGTDHKDNMVAEFKEMSEGLPESWGREHEATRLQNSALNPEQQNTMQQSNLTDEERRNQFKQQGLFGNKVKVGG